MPAQSFKTVDLLRLMVGRRPKTGLINLIKNPSGELGGWGWVTPNLGQVISGTGTALRLVPPGARNTWAYTEDIPITPGRYVSARIRTGTHQRVNEGIRIALAFYNAAGVEIAVSGSSAYLERNVTGYTPTMQAPAGTVGVALRITASSNGQINGTDGAFYVEWKETTLVTAAAASDIPAGYGYIEPFEWTNILSPATNIVIDREELNLGVLSATIRSATLDPAVDDLIRPGNPVIVSATPDAGVTWSPLFTGTINNAASVYDYHQTDPDKRAKITLSAVDPVSAIANVKRPRGVANVADLRAILEGCGVPWLVNGDSSHSGDNYRGRGGTQSTAVFIVTNPDANALDQVTITRDSKLAKAWVTRFGQIAVYDSIALPTTVRATLDETTYSDLSVDYDTDRCINTVTVKLLRTNLATGQTVEVAYGPYVDQASVERWGARSAEFRVQGLSDNEATISAYAAQVLAANATPQVRVNSVRLPITTNAGFSLGAGTRRAFLDLYDRVTLVNANAGLNQDARVTGMKHTITPDKWLVDLSFGSTGTVSSPQATPAAPGGVVAAVNDFVSAEIALWGSTFNVGSTTYGNVGNTITFTSSGPGDVFLATFSVVCLVQTAGLVNFTTLALDGAPWWPSDSVRAFGGSTGTWVTVARTVRLTGIAAGSHTLGIRSANNGAGNTQVSGPDSLLTLIRLT
jgi:hypothetical protein